MKTLTALAAALMATVLTMTGCSSSEPDHNQADVGFASDMIPHHAQAIAMADMTIGQPGVSRELETMAERIRQAQTHEINLMAGWLRGWGEDVPQTGYGRGDAHDHAEGMKMMHEDMAGMPGMMGADEMRRLGRAHGVEFEQMWLAMMIEHHEGAIEMSRREQEHGRSEAAVALAVDVAAAQRAEIETMRTMLAKAKRRG